MSRQEATEEEGTCHGKGAKVVKGGAQAKTLQVTRTHASEPQLHVQEEDRIGYACHVSPPTPVRPWDRKGAGRQHVAGQ